MYIYIYLYIIGIIDLWMCRCKNVSFKRVIFIILLILLWFYWFIFLHLFSRISLLLGFSLVLYWPYSASRTITSSLLLWSPHSFIGLLTDYVIAVQRQLCTLKYPCKLFWYSVVVYSLGCKSCSIREFYWIVAYPVFQISSCISG